MNGNLNESHMSESWHTNEGVMSHLKFGFRNICSANTCHGHTHEQVMAHI